MSKQLNIRIPDETKAEIEQVLKNRDLTIGKFVAEAISMALTIEKNMDEKQHSRLVIENPKDQPKDIKLLIRS